MRKAAAPLTVLLCLVTIVIVPQMANAVTWSAEAPVTDLSSYDALPRITQLRNGSIWAVWQSNILGNMDIIYSVYRDGNWSGVEPLVADENTNSGPTVFQAENGTIWLFYSSLVVGAENYDIYYRTWTQGQGDWSDPRQLTNHPNDDTYPAAIQARNGSIFVVWQRRAYPASYDNVMYKVCNGSHWSNEYLLTTSAGDDRVPAIAQTRDGRIWVVWSSFRTGDWEIFYKTSGGSSWSADQRLTVSSNDDVNPSIVQARDGSIWVVWSSSKSTPSATDDLYYKTSNDNGDTWSASTQLTTDTADDLWPSIAQISDKKLWVVWTTNRGYGYDIYYKTSSEITAHDVAISDIRPAFTLLSQRQTVPINVTAKNNGDSSETFTVTCYINSTLIGSQGVTLDAGASTTLTFQWDTTTFAAGKYIAKASASSVPGENPASTDDNTLQDDEIIIVVNHDRAILDVSPLRSSIAQGYVLKIQVTVKNEGTYTDTFDVTLKYDSAVIETRRVTDLGSNESKTLVFQWSVNNVPFGTYTISASIVPAPYEKDLADNTRSGGSVRVKLPGDVDGDSDVDIADLSWIARAFGTDSSWPEGTDWDQWNPDADINNDNKVDVVDLYIAATNYGRIE